MTRDIPATPAPPAAAPDAMAELLRKLDGQVNRHLAGVTSGVTSAVTSGVRSGMRSDAVQRERAQIEVTSFKPQRLEPAQRLQAGLACVTPPVSPLPPQPTPAQARHARFKPVLIALVVSTIGLPILLWWGITASQTDEPLSEPTSAPMSELSSPAQVPATRASPPTATPAVSPASAAAPVHLPPSTPSLPQDCSNAQAALGLCPVPVR
jgi:hypothetical protein